MRIWYGVITGISLCGVLHGSTGATLWQAQQISKPVNKPHSSSTAANIKAYKNRVQDFNKILKEYCNGQFPTINQRYMWAAICGKTADARECLNKGADANFIDQIAGDSALMVAARLGHEQVVRLILLQNQCINIRLKNKWGYTALAAATAGSSCNPIVIKYLLEHGAQPAEAVGYAELVQQCIPTIPRV